MGESGPAANAGDRLDQPHLPGFRSLAGQSVLYATGGLAQKVAGLLLVPLLARVLTPAEFGRLEVLSTMASTLTGIAVLGLDVVITRRWADVDQAGRRRSFSTWLTISLLVGLPLLGILFAYGAPLSDALFEDAAGAWGVRLVGAFALLNLLQTVGLTALRNQQRARSYAATSIVTVLCNFVLVTLLVLSARDEVAVMLGITLAAGLGASISLALSRNLVFGRPDITEGRHLIHRALPLVPGIALTLGGDLASRFILLASAGETEVAYLSIALRFTGIGLLVITGFQLAWHPRAYAIAKQDGGIGRLGQDASAMVLLMAVLTLALAALSPELLRVLGGAGYDEALPTVGFALLVPLGLLGLLITTLPSAIENRMGDLGTATALAAIATIALTVLLAPPFGAAGAAAALMGGQVVGAAVGILLGRRALAQRLPHRRSVLALASGATAATLVVTVTEIGQGVLVRSVLVLAFSALVIGWELPTLRSAVRMVRRQGIERS